MQIPKQLLITTFLLTLPIWLIGQTPPAPNFVTVGGTGSSSSSVGIKWTYKSPYTTYKIYRANSPGGPYSLVETVSNVTNSSKANWVDNSGIEPLTEYCYKVRTCDGSRCSGDSPNGCHTTPDIPLPIPDPPRQLTVTALSDTELKVRWKNSISASSYDLFYCNGVRVKSNISSNTTGWTDYTVSSLDASTNFCFKVKGCNNTGCSDFSDDASGSTEPGTPNVSATAISTSSIRLSWNRVAGASKYNIFNNNSSTSKGSTTSTSFTINGLSPNTQYCYQVTALVDNVQSDKSNAACATTSNNPTPDDVSNFSAAVVNDNQIRLTWNAVANITGYRIERKINSTNWIARQTNLSPATSYIDFDVVAGTTYQYRIKARNNTSYSDNFAVSNEVTMPALASSITITRPTSGATYLSGATTSINWTNENFSDNVNIEYNLNGTWESAANNITNTGTYSWTIPTVTTATTIAKIRVSSTDATVSDESDAFTINPPITATCPFGDLTTDHPAYTAIQALCANGIIDENAAEVKPDDPINKAELAKLVYYGLALNDSPPFAVRFPSPFNDLQDNQQWYHDAAKTLSYLEYGDGIAPFNRDKFDFLPSATYTRAAVLQTLIEGFDITLQTSNIPFTDTGLEEHSLKAYIETAYSIGFTDVNFGLFRPDAAATRGEVFIMLFKLLEIRATNLPTISDTDFFIPGIYSPENFSRGATVAEGNFKAFGKTPFAISGIGLPLVFSFSYNSYWTELPNEFFKMRPLGDGWTHSFNSYLLETKADNQYAKDRIMTLMPGGNFHVYDKTTLAPFTNGVYNQMAKIGDKYTITTKNQIVYTFEQPTGIYDEGLYLLSAIADRNGNTITLTYQTAENVGTYRLHQISGTSGRKLTFSYTGGGTTIRQVADPSGRTVQFTYNNTRNSNVDLLTYQDAKGQTTQFNYFTEVGNEHLIKTITLPKGNTITNAYHQRKLTSSQNSAGNAMTIAIPSPSFTNPADFLHTMVDVTTQTGDRIRHESTFDKMGNLIEQTGAGNTLDIDYTDTNNEMYPSKVTINGTAVDYTYDTDGDLLRVDYPNGSYEAYTYTTLNDLKTYRNANGNTTTYTYTNGNLTSIKDPMDFTTTISRQSNGLISSITNPENITQSFTYDTYGNVKKVTLPLGISSTATYDILGRLQTATDANSRTTTYTYDKNDNLIQEINPLGATKGKTTYTFDANDNLTGITNAKGKTTALNYEFETDFLESVTFGDATDAYEYDKDGRIKKFTKPSGTSFNYTYDANRRLTNDGYAGYTYRTDNLINTVSNSTGTISYAYDVLKRVENITFDNQTIGYKYDNVGNLTELNYPNNKTVYYTYDKNNRLTKVKDWNNQETNYTYRKDGALLTTQYPNGITTTYSYDELGRITSSAAQGNSTIYSYDFSIDPLGNHLSENYTAPFVQLNSFQDNTTDYTYNDQNELLTAGTTNFVHDADGRITQKGSTQFIYDKRDQLLSANMNSQNLGYTYDGLGNRRSRTENGTTTKYVLDISGMSQVLMETDDNGNPKHYYIYGLGLINRIDAIDNSRFYHFDHRGSTIAMTDANQTITHSYFYDDFGYPLHTQEEDFNPFRYVGMYGVMYEQEDLQFMRARFYDGEVGRFLSEDPIWASNLYRYSSNNPVGRIDPTGLIDDRIEEIKTTRGNTKGELKKLRKIIRHPENNGRPRFRDINCDNVLESIQMTEQAIYARIQENTVLHTPDNGHNIAIDNEKKFLKKLYDKFSDCNNQGGGSIGVSNTSYVNERNFNLDLQGNAKIIQIGGVLTTLVVGGVIVYTSAPAGLAYAVVLFLAPNIIQP